MTDLRKAAEQALEALEYYRSFEDCQPTPASKTIPALRQALAQRKTLAELLAATPVDEYQYEVVAEHANGTYTTKRIPKRQWVGLTEADRIDIIDAEIMAPNTEHFALAQSIEARLKEKNT